MGKEVYIIRDEDYLEHHGIKGQKWGIRRYQNNDGSLTEEGKQRYGVDSSGRMSREGKKRFDADRKNAVKEAQKERAKMYEENKRAPRKEDVKVGMDLTNKYIKEKYGNITYADLRKADRSKNAGKAWAIGSGITAGYIALIGATAIGLTKLVRG